jgi:hypothetical protein
MLEIINPILERVEVSNEFIRYWGPLHLLSIGFEVGCTNNLNRFHWANMLTSQFLTGELQVNPLQRADISVINLLQIADIRAINPLQMVSI